MEWDYEFIYQRDSPGMTIQRQSKRGETQMVWSDADEGVKNAYDD